MNKAKNREVYADWITRYYSSHKYIPDGHSDGELIGRLIRCKDCEWQMSEWLVINHKPILNHYCSYHDYTDGLGDDDDFCSKAERREDDQTD